MVSAGDLVRSADGYRLADRLLARQRRQDDAMRPQLRSWRGTWTTLIITSVGTDARIRAALRTTLHQKRFGELREGVWMRPDNLELDLDADVRDRVRIVHAHDDDPVELAGQLWDLPSWAHTGERLLADMTDAGDVPDKFVTAAGDGAPPADRPGAARRVAPQRTGRAPRLRAAYNDFAAELLARRDDIRLVEAT